MGAELCKGVNPKELKDLKDNTSFSGREIKTWYKKYCKDSNFDGPMTKSEFVTMYQKLFPNGDAEEFCDKVFKTYDHNGDGLIDFRELMLTLNVTLKGTVEEKLKWTFQVYDINNDGTITRDEALTIMKAIFKAKGAKDLPIDEMDVVNELFLTLKPKDENHITETEFINGAKNSPNLMTSLMTC